MSKDRLTRILVADDREENRYILCRLLTGAGYQCDEASTGEQALSLAKTIPDLIILDVRLPDLSGYEVCRRLKENPQTSLLPFCRSPPPSQVAKIA